MKNSTKLKIIQFVEKLLRYKQPIIPPIQEKKIDIQYLRSECYCSESIDIEIYKLDMVRSISTALSDMHAIKFQISNDGFSQQKVLKAELRYLNPE